MIQILNISLDKILQINKDLQMPTYEYNKKVLKQKDFQKINNEL